MVFAAACLIALVLFGYWLVPELMVHGLHFSATGRVPEARGAVALTFDDGPGVATEAILDLLAANNAKATFFLVGERAAAAPETVARLVAQGHEVGAHGYAHRSFLTTAPGTTCQMIARGIEAVERVSGGRVRLFRPPWGHMNLSAWRYAARAGLELVFWSVNAGDWLPGRSPQAIARAIVDARDGDVVLLHDAGGDGRGRTVEALRLALPELRRRGLCLVTVSTLLAKRTRGPGFLFRIWEAWERLYGALWHAEEVGGADDLLRVTRGRYRGPDLVAPNGRRLTRGDPYLEVHFKNRELAEAGAIRGMKRMRQSLRRLADFVAEREEAADIEFLMGITVLSQPVQLFGFHVVDLPPGLGTWWAGAYRRWLLRVYHPAGGRRLAAAHQELRPRLAYITREELLARYGRQPAREEGTRGE